MSYGKVKDTFWTDKKVRGLSDDAKMLALYLMTGPHRNMLGCMRIPDGYLLADLEWSSKRLSDAIAMLSESHFIVRDEDGWTLILNQLKHDPLKVPNHARAAVALMEEVPTDSVVYQHLAPKLKAALDAIDMASLWHPHEIAIPIPSPLPKPLPEPEPSAGNAIAPGGARPSSEIDKAFRNYNLMAENSGLAQAEKLTGDRRKGIGARLKDHGLETWNRALGAIETSPFLLGQNDKGWRADLDFMCQAKSFNRIIEGFYADKGRAA